MVFPYFFNGDETMKKIACVAMAAAMITAGGCVTDGGFFNFLLGLLTGGVS